MLRVISIAFVALFALSACDTMSSMTGKDHSSMKAKEMKDKEMMKKEMMKKEMKDKEMMKKK